jgi:hypothetical protein
MWFVRGQEVLQYCEDLELLRLYDGVERFFAIVSEGVQMSGGTDPDLKGEVGGYPSYC